MTQDKIDIDTGHTLINLNVEHGRYGTIITAFVNGMSVRSGSLHLPRIAERFVDCVITACDFGITDADNRDSLRTEDDLMAFIKSTTSPN
jgi:hypothetical protein